MNLYSQCRTALESVTITKTLIGLFSHAVSGVRRPFVVEEQSDEPKVPIDYYRKLHFHMVADYESTLLSKPILRIY